MDSLHVQISPRVWVSNNVFAISLSIKQGVRLLILRSIPSLIYDKITDESETLRQLGDSVRAEALAMDQLVGKWNKPPRLTFHKLRGNGGKEGRKRLLC